MNSTVPNPQTHEVDCYRHVSRLTQRIVKSWIAAEAPREIPWTPVTKPLSESTVAIISSAGIALKDDRPFDQQGERDNPWWGDPSFRVIPRDTRSGDIRAYHLHVNTTLIEQDMNVALPLERLAEMEAAGEIGRVAPHHYGIMGYLLQPDEMLEKTVPAIVQGLRDDHVDVVVLVPV